MKVLKTMLMVLLLSMSTTKIIAQANHELLGKWKAVYEEEGEKTFVTYEFKNEGGKLICYTRYLEDAKGDGAAYNSIAMKDIDFTKGSGKAKYLLEDGEEKYELKATLELKNANTLNISYSYWGYSDTEVWKRIKQ